jgi:hypothetical protein
MLWIFVFGGIALAGLIMSIAYTVWLAHKTADVMSEVRVLGDRTGQLFVLLGQIEVPEAPRGVRPDVADLQTVEVSEYPAT